jgi:hypothetical protein
LGVPFESQKVLSHFVRQSTVVWKYQFLVLREPVLNGDFAAVTEWRVSEIVCQPHSAQHGGDVPLGDDITREETVVEGEVDTDAARQVRNFVRVRKPSMDAVVSIEREDLCFVRKPADRRRKQDSIVVAFVFGPCAIETAICATRRPCVCEGTAILPT